MGICYSLHVSQRNFCVYFIDVNNMLIAGLSFIGALFVISIVCWILTPPEDRYDLDELEKGYYSYEEKYGRKF